jgi:hypothetical protein
LIITLPLDYFHSYTVTPAKVTTLRPYRESSDIPIPFLISNKTHV